MTRAAIPSNFSAWIAILLLTATAVPAEAQKKKVVFMAGTPSHGYGSHEHNAGCMLLAKSLQQSVDNVEVLVHRNGWPKDSSVFDGADVLVSVPAHLRTFEIGGLPRYTGVFR